MAIILFIYIYNIYFSVPKWEKQRLVVFLKYPLIKTTWLVIFNSLTLVTSARNQRTLTCILSMSRIVAYVLPVPVNTHNILSFCILENTLYFSVSVSFVLLFVCFWLSLSAFPFSGAPHPSITVFVPVCILCHFGILTDERLPLSFAPTFAAIYISP